MRMEFSIKGNNNETMIAGMLQDLCIAGPAHAQSRYMFCLHVSRIQQVNRSLRDTLVEQEPQATSRSTISSSRLLAAQDRAWRMSSDSRSG